MIVTGVIVSLLWDTDKYLMYKNPLDSIVNYISILFLMSFKIVFLASLRGKTDFHYVSLLFQKNNERCRRLFCL